MNYSVGVREFCEDLAEYLDAPSLGGMITVIKVDPAENRLNNDRKWPDKGQVLAPIRLLTGRVRCFNAGALLREDVKLAVSARSRSVECL